MLIAGWNKVLKMKETILFFHLAAAKLTVRQNDAKKRLWKNIVFVSGRYGIDERVIEK